MSDPSKTLVEYQSFKNGKGYFVDREAKAIQLSGKDRCSFLHNFCTADVKGLKPGESTEAFILNPKGKTLFFVQILGLEERLIILIPARQLDDLEKHLSKYLIVEDVSINCLDQAQVVYTHWDSADGFACQLGAQTRVQVLPTPDAQNVFDAWAKEDRTEISRETFESIRVESRFPISGIDVTEDCLAQEFERDASAISYTKGCYLGQETVARLDALGHTNRSFSLAKCESESAPDLLSPLKNEGKDCGKATSVAWSIKLQCYLILAMVKKPNHQPGHVLQLGGQDVTLIANES